MQIVKVEQVKQWTRSHIVTLESLARNCDIKNPDGFKLSALIISVIEILKEEKEATTSPVNEFIRLQRSQTHVIRP